MIRFIYFDLDDTLLDHRRAEHRGLEDVCRTYAAHFAHVSVDAVQRTYHAHSVPLWGQYADGALTKDALKRLRFERTLDELGVVGLDARTVNDVYIDYYTRHWTFVGGARSAFHRLADHLPVGILTNGFAEVQQEKFARFPELTDRASALVISEEVGVMKPHPRIFAHAENLAGVPADALLYVGDSYTSDVRGALGAGWQVAWFTPSPPPHDVPDDARVFRFATWDALLERVLAP